MSAASMDPMTNIIKMGTDWYVIVELPCGGKITVYRNGKVTGDDGRELTAPPF